MLLKLNHNCFTIVLLLVIIFVSLFTIYFTFSGCSNKTQWTFVWDFKVTESMIKSGPDSFGRVYYKIADDPVASSNEIIDNYEVTFTGTKVPDQIISEEDISTEKKSWQYIGIIFVENDEDFADIGLDAGIWVDEHFLSVYKTSFEGATIKIEPVNK